MWVWIPAGRSFSQSSRLVSDRLRSRAPLVTGESSGPRSARVSDLQGALDGAHQRAGTSRISTSRLEELDLRENRHHANTPTSARVVSGPRRFRWGAILGWLAMDAPAPQTPLRSDPKPAPSDWYDDPDGAGGERYWDGGRWTQQRRPKAEATVDLPGSSPTWRPTARPSQTQPNRRVSEPSAPQVDQGTVIADGGVEVAGAGQAAAASRLEAVRRATTTWTGQLVDLTGRNSLLYYRDLKVGNFCSSIPPPGQLIYAVLAGRPASLSKLFPD